MESELIDLKWALIDGSWTIYQSELNSWVRSQKTPSNPPCPVCGQSAGIMNIEDSELLKTGICKNCKAKLAILKDIKKTVNK
jgi:hypothetical protein